MINVDPLLAQAVLLEEFPAKEFWHPDKVP